MALSEQYQDDAVGGVAMGDHAANTELSGITPTTGFTSNRAAFTLIALGVIGLWIIWFMFKGA